MPPHLIKIALKPFLLLMAMKTENVSAEVSSNSLLHVASRFLLVNIHA